MNRAPSGLASLFTALLASVCACLAACLLGACTTPTPPTDAYVVLLANPQGGVGQVLVQGSRGQQTLREAGYAAPLDGASPPAPVDAERFMRDFSEVLAARPRLPQHYMLYFDKGSTQPVPGSEAVLAQVLADCQQRDSAELLVVGHADALGATEVNEGLSLRRAQRVADMLMQHGLRVDSLRVSAQGQREPQSGTPPSAEVPRNRRVEITVR